MPYSSIHGKDWLRRTLEATQVPPPHTVIDVGPGAGSYLDLLNGIWPEAKFIGIEVYSTYVSQFNLKDRYDDIIIADIRHLDFGTVPAGALWVFGDVLEHMDRGDAEIVLNKALGVADAWARGVVISVPLGEYPQGAVDGNEYEAHVDTYLPGDINRMFPWAKVHSLEDNGIGVYLIDPDEGL